MLIGISLKKISPSNLLPVYTRLPINFTHGDGVWLFDAQSNRYLDLISCMAVSPLGHNNKLITSTICQQSNKIIHSSNMVTIPEQERLANLLVTCYQQPAKVFFNNSGNEAVETAIKLARLYGHSKNISRAKIIVMEKAFHGRSIATLSASDNINIQQGFAPLLDCFIRVPFNDISAIEQVANNTQDPQNIVAILLEPIQGEGGIVIPDPDYLNNITTICAKNNWLLMVDEIQSGLARTGKFFCYQHANITPDVVMLAKGLANGIPIGACIIKDSLAELFKPRSHGSTFGGNQLACSTAIACLTQLTDVNLQQQIVINGEYFLTNLQKYLHNNAVVAQIRGKGLMIGIELKIPCVDLIAKALEHGLYINVTRQNTIRLLPPLIIEKPHIDFAVERLVTIIEQLGN